MSNKETAKIAQAQTARNIFEGIIGRPPNTDEELQKWVSSAEGRAAMMFDSTSGSRWGETGRS